MTSPHAWNCRCTDCRAGAVRVTFVDPFTAEVEKRFCSHCGIRLARSNPSRLCYLHASMEHWYAIKRELEGLCKSRGCDEKTKLGHQYCAGCCRTKYHTNTVGMTWRR